MIPRLHAVTDDGILRRNGFLDVARSVMASGGAGLAFHLRGPNSPGRFLFHLAEALAASAETSGSLLIANDRVDVALCLGLSGVHLGQRSLPPPAARGLLGPDRLLGLSVHGIDEVPEEAKEELDYLIVGTIFSSDSHPDGPLGGTKRIRAVAGVTELPQIAIGGMNAGNAAEVMSAGAHGVAVRGAIWEAGDPALATRELLDALEEGNHS